MNKSGKLNVELFIFDGVLRMITDSLRSEYIGFQNNGEKAKIVKLLTSALKNEVFTDEERCWTLWNISDNLAMLRKPDDELANHKLFEKHILQMDSKYLNWIVSDGTQKMTLIVGGYEQYWFDLYKFACRQSVQSAENRRIRFESHRASVAIPIMIEYNFNKENSLFALDNMKNMLPELKDDYNYKFYELTYFTQYIGAHTLLDNVSDMVVDESLHSFSNIIKYLSCVANEHDDDDIYLIGSWQQLNGVRSKYNQTKCAISNYIISLINAGKHKVALNCYEKMVPYNLSVGSYFNSKIEYAKSQCNFGK
jgi:hypothetical protein